MPPPQVFAPADPTPRQPIATAPGPEIVNLAAHPSLAEMELVSRIRILFAKARAERKPYVQQWVRNHRIMRNRTWLGTRPDWMPAPEVPEIRPIIGSCVAWVTDQRPEFDLMPAAQPFSPFAAFFEQLASDMKTAINANWQTYMREVELAKIVWDAYQYDIGIAKTVWNPALADGLGDAEFRRIDPFTWYPDPQGSCMDDKNYFIEARTISLQELDRRFPGTAALFDVQGYTENVDEMPNLRLGVGQMPRANPGALAPATTARYGLPGQSRDRASRDDSGVTLLECWLREHMLIPSPDGKAKRVYECWRCVVVAGPHVLMNKRATELLPFPTHPYDKYMPEDLGEFVGQSMVELLAPSQISINRLLASMQQNIDLVGNPIFKESSRSSLQRQKITNRPGTRVTVAAGDTESGWMLPPTLQEMMPKLVEFYIREMERISGLSAIANNMANSRVASDQLDTMMEHGFVRVRMAQRSLEFMLRGVGQKLAAIIGEFYTEPRMVSVVGPSGEKTASVLRAQHFYVPSADGAAPLRFQMQVRAGSMSATSRNSRIGEVDALFAMGAVDRPVVLEEHNVPNREAILQRIADAEAKGTFNAPGARQRARH